MFASTFSVLALVATSLLASTPVAASSSNFTVRAGYASSSATCAKVSGTAYGSKFDFGCLCLDDLDDFCDNNSLNDYFQGILSKYISSYGKTFSYPSYAQPTCDNSGGYNCGTLTKLSNGQCSSSNPCPTSTHCFSNGGCCPRGQTYKNGYCCATTGCSRSGSVCTPILDCTTYKSNNICCPAGTSGWTGQKTRCCPTGQIESADGSDCICPAGKKEDPKDANKCVDACVLPSVWGATKCCPKNAPEKDGVCVCPTGSKLSGDQLSCVDSCDTTNGWKWCNQRCCPKGSDEDSHGKCVCSDPQSVLNKDGTACVDRCPNGNWGSSMCCNGASKEVSGVCVCTSASQTYTGTGDAGMCTDKCTGGGVWGPKQQKCCPAGSTENSAGMCMCTDASKKIDNNSCVPKCTGSTTYNPTTQTCCPTGSTVVNGACGCPSISQKLENNACVPKCKNSWVFGAGPNKDGCCPPTAKPDSTGTCVCNDPSYKLSGSGDSASCIPKCTISGWTYAPTQNKCCPPNSIEVNGACQCKDNTQTITGTDDNRVCTSRCTPGWSWGGISKKCCPPGSIEDCDGDCSCTNPAQVITGSGTSQACTNLCDGKPSTWKAWTSLCCPPGSRQKGTVCDCDDDNLRLSDDKQSCINICPTGQYNAGSRCCPNDSRQWGYGCLCNKWLSGYTLSPDQSKCIPTCPWGSTFQDTQCCKNYLDEKDGKCVCPNAGDVDNGASCKPSCPSGKTYNPTTKGCDTICADGFTFQKGYKGDGFCCRTSETACNTRCCPAPYVEIGDTGVCCNAGAQVVAGKCVGASGKAPNPKTRRSLENGQKIQLTPGKPVDTFFGIEANRDGKLCPTGLAACPIAGRDSSEWECLDSQTDLQSCGGCASMGTGEDCTSIPGARWMGCRVGKCEVYSCKAGWRMVMGKCEKK